MHETESPLQIQIEVPEALPATEAVQSDKPLNESATNPLLDDFADNDEEAPADLEVPEDTGLSLESAPNEPVRASESGAVQFVVTLTEWSVADFDTFGKDTFIAASAESLGVKQEQVSIAEVREGSVVVTAVVNQLTSPFAVASVEARARDPSGLAEALTSAGLGACSVVVALDDDKASPEHPAAAAATEDDALVDTLFVAPAVAEEGEANGVTPGGGGAAVVIPGDESSMSPPPQPLLPMPPVQASSSSSSSSSGFSISATETIDVVSESPSGSEEAAPSIEASAGSNDDLLLASPVAPAPPSPSRYQQFLASSAAPAPPSPSLAASPSNEAAVGNDDDLLLSSSAAPAPPSPSLAASPSIEVTVGNDDDLWTVVDPEEGNEEGLTTTASAAEKALDHLFQESAAATAEAPTSVVSADSTVDPAADSAAAAATSQEGGGEAERFRSLLTSHGLARFVQPLSFAGVLSAEQGALASEELLLGPGVQMKKNHLLKFRRALGQAPPAASSSSSSSSSVPVSRSDSGLLSDDGLADSSSGHHGDGAFPAGTGGGPPAMNQPRDALAPGQVTGGFGGWDEEEEEVGELSPSKRSAKVGRSVRKTMAKTTGVRGLLSGKEVKWCHSCGSGTVKAQRAACKQCGGIQWDNHKPPGAAASV